MVRESILDLRTIFFFLGFWAVISCVRKALFHYVDISYSCILAGFLLAYSSLRLIGLSVTGSLSYLR